MMKSSPFTPAERLESLKAAVLGGAWAGGVSLLWLLGQPLLSQQALPFLNDGVTHLAALTLLVQGVIALLSGSLFALTYRYAVRQDDNPQLNTGVVLAFTLVRGLAAVDGGTAIAQHFWPWLITCGESLLLFGGGAIALNLAFRYGGVKRFGKV
jgi:hypothetical protein